MLQASGRPSWSESDSPLRTAYAAGRDWCRSRPLPSVHIDAAVGKEDSPFRRGVLQHPQSVSRGSNPPPAAVPPRRRLSGQAAWTPRPRARLGRVSGWSTPYWRGTLLRQATQGVNVPDTDGSARLLNRACWQIGGAGQEAQPCHRHRTVRLRLLLKVESVDLWPTFLNDDLRQLLGDHSPCPCGACWGRCHATDAARIARTISDHRVASWVRAALSGTSHRDGPRNTQKTRRHQDTDGPSGVRR